jgi:hypothetical protein
LGDELPVDDKDFEDDELLMDDEVLEGDEILIDDKVLEDDELLIDPDLRTLRKVHATLPLPQAGADENISPEDEDLLIHLKHEMGLTWLHVLLHFSRSITWEYERSRHVPKPRGT